MGAGHRVVGQVGPEAQPPGAGHRTELPRAGDREGKMSDEEWSLADDLRRENELLHHRFVHATRSKEPMTFEEAERLQKRLLGGTMSRTRDYDGGSLM